MVKHVSFNEVAAFDVALYYLSCLSPEVVQLYVCTRIKNNVFPLIHYFVFECTASIYEVIIYFMHWMFTVVAVLHLCLVVSEQCSFAADNRDIYPSFLQPQIALP